MPETLSSYHRCSEALHPWTSIRLLKSQGASSAMNLPWGHASRSGKRHQELQWSGSSSLATSKRHSQEQKIWKATRATNLQNPSPWKKHQCTPSRQETPRHSKSYQKIVPEAPILSKSAEKLQFTSKSGRTLQFTGNHARDSNVLEILQVAFSALKIVQETRICSKLSKELQFTLNRARVSNPFEIVQEAPLH